MHPSDIRIGQTELSIIELYEMMQSNQLIITINSGTWGAYHKSMSVESILLGLTMTPIYVDASLPNEWLVLDGGKRLDVLNKFISNKFDLTELEFLEELNGCYFFNLPKTTQRRLLQSKFTVYSINQGVSPEVRLSLIRRIVPDLKSGLSLKMLERLLTPEALELVDNMNDESIEIISKLFHKNKEEYLSLKIGYLNILYSIFKKERFENYDIFSKPEDVIIFTNQYAKRDTHFILETWSSGLKRLEKLLVSYDIPPEVNQFLNRYFEYFIISLGQITNQEYDILGNRNLQLIWEIADYLHNEDGRSRFLKYAKQQRINQIYKFIKETIKENDRQN